VQLRPTRTLIETQRYPLTTEEFLAVHGDHRIELQNGVERLGDVLGRLPPTTYTRPSDLYEDVVGCLGHEAIGRRYYSDRDAATVGEDGPDPLSF
jgi:hypothetical protein